MLTWSWLGKQSQRSQSRKASNGWRRPGQAKEGRLGKAKADMTDTLLPSSVPPWPVAMPSACPAALWAVRERKKGSKNAVYRTDKRRACRR